MACTGYFAHPFEKSHRESDSPGCTGYLGHPFQIKQGKSCVENLVRDVDKEE